MIEANNSSPAPSRNCPHCGEDLAFDALFCTACGRPVPISPPPPPAPLPNAPAVICPSCGTKLEAGTHFCGACGHALTGPPAQAPTAPVRHINQRPAAPVRETKRRGCLAAVVLVLALVVAAGAGLIWWAPWDGGPRTDRWRTLSQQDMARFARAKTFELSREVTLLSGKLRGQVAVVLEAEGSNVIPQAEVGAEGQDGVAVSFKVPPQARGEVRWYSVRVTVGSLSSRGSQGGQVWQAIEGRWLGEVESAQSNGGGVYSCRVPCRADSGAACELHLVLSSDGGSSLKVAPVLRLSFSP
jgi:hypothetical protein